MRASGDTQVISGKTSAAPPMARAPRWTRWKSSGKPSVAEYIAMGETMMRLRSVRSRTLNGVNIGGGTAPFGAGSTPGALGEPALVAFQPDLVAQAQVFVADALRARQHRIHELLGLKRVGIALADHLEPLHGVARRILDARDIDAPHFLIGAEHGRDAGLVVADEVELAGQFDGVVDRQLGAGADGEMRRMRAVAHQHDMAPAVEMAPLLADQAAEIQPGRAAQMARVGHQSVAVQRLGEQSFSQNAMDWSWSISSRPCALNTSSVVSTMKVEVLASKR